MALPRAALALLLALSLAASAGAQVQYDRDTVAGAADKLNMQGCVRKDTAGATVGADGDRAPCIIDANGMVWVTLGTAATVIGNVASGATDAEAPVKVGGVYNSTPITLTNGQRGDLQVDAKGNVLLVIRDAAGNARGVNVTAGNALVVDGSAVTQPVSGTVTANAGTNLNTSTLLTTTAHDNAFGTAGTADAQVRSIQGIASMTPVQVSQATASNLNATVVGTGTFSVQVSTFPDNEPFNVAQINGVTPLMGAGGTGTGSQRVTEANDSQLSAGVGATGDAAPAAGGTGSLTAKLRLITTQLDAIQTAVQLIDNDQTGATWHSLISAATVNATSVKGSAGTVYGIVVTNINAAVRYIRFYNLASAPTCSSATGIAGRFAIPAAATGAGFVFPIPPAGIAFSTGIGYCLTTGSADTDNNAVAAGEVVVNIVYK